MGSFWEMGKMIFFTWLSSVWAITEPLLALFQIFFRLGSKSQIKLNEEQFKSEVSKAYIEIKAFLETYGFEDFFHDNVDLYIDHVKTEVSKDDSLYKFIDGRIHYSLITKADLPTENRINKFAIASFLFIRGKKKFLSGLLIRERFVQFFKKKNSYYHYLSIDGWSTKNYTLLVNEIEEIDKVDPLFNQRFRFPKEKSIDESKPAISRAIDNVIAKGKISERSIFNLATSEKLILIHKYGEGFSNVYRGQSDYLNELKLLKEKWEKSKAQKANSELQKVNTQISKLKENWVRVPISSSLEEFGFQKLFSKMDGVYVLPLSMIPNKYHNNIDGFINEIVIENAKNKIQTEYEKGNNFIEEDNLDLKYLILAHIVPVHKLKIINQNREMEYSSPVLSKMLLTSYLSNDNTTVSNLYISDIVRNVDFISQLKNDRKTDRFLSGNIEILKRILWNDFGIDLMKPFNLQSLTEIQVEDVCAQLILEENAPQIRFLKSKLLDIVNFYGKLSSEINEISN